MLKAIYRKGKACPVIACDVCNDMIGEVSDGVALVIGPPSNASNALVMHVHKGVCRCKVGKQHEDIFEQDITAHFFVALINSCLTKASFEQMLDRMDGSGGLQEP